jgi:hypothetical protein
MSYGFLDALSFTRTNSRLRLHVLLAGKSDQPARSLSHSLCNSLISALFATTMRRASCRRARPPMQPKPPRSSHLLVAGSPKVAVYPSRNETDADTLRSDETDLKTHRVTFIKRKSRASPAPNYSRFSTSSDGAKPPLLCDRR